MQNFKQEAFERENPGSPGELGAEDYLNLLRARIRSLQQYPAQALSHRQIGIVEIEFTILKDGQLTEVHVADASSFVSLNAAALKAVTAVHKFLPIPPELHRERWVMTIPVLFKIGE